MSRVFWDTNLFVYLFEDYGPFTARVVEVRKRMRERGDELIASTLTLGEIMVKPIEKSNRALAQRYREALSTQATLIAFDENVAALYAVIRGDRTIRAPDAIQLACAAQAKADLFLTNDLTLAKKKVRGIQFIASLENAPL